MGYSKRHLVIFEDSNNSKNRFINITFDAEPGTNKSLSVRLSDDDDLYFLYTTSISEDDFITIKSQQGLLVDFAGFRQRVVDLLKQCSSEEENSIPKYMLKFARCSDSERACFLQIIEATNFKYLTHLSLRLLAGDDEAVKAYLVGQLRILRTESKRQIDCLEKRLADTSSLLSDTEKKYDSSLQEIDNLKSISSTREALLTSEYEDRINALRERYQKAEAEHQDSLAKEQRSFAEACESVRKEFTSKLEACRQSNEELLGTRDRLLVSVKELKEHVASLETENSSSQERLSSTRAQLSSMEQVCQNQSATISRLETRLATIDQDMTVKEQLLSKTQELLALEREQKNKLQDELQSQSSRIEKLQKSVEQESEEVKKANEIIKHLQSEVKSHHTKAKLRGQVAAEQERLLSAKESELQDRSNELDRVRNDLRKASDTIATLTDQLNQTSAALSDAQKTIKTNENIIGWLNRQISESQIGQVQQRLRSSGLATPATCFNTLPSHSCSEFTSSNGKTGTVMNPVRHPPNSVTNPSNNVISRFSTTCSTSTAFPSAVTFGSYPSDTPNPTPSSMRPIHSDLATEKRIPTSNDSNFMLKPDLRTISIPAPITKSTPLHSDVVVNSANPARFDLGHGPTTTTRLPLYIPSTLVSRIRASTLTDIGDPVLGTSTSKPRTTVTNAQPDCEQATAATLHQQSLTSAYFPKPVGTGSHS